MTALYADDTEMHSSSKDIVPQKWPYICKTQEKETMVIASHLKPPGTLTYSMEIQF